jgi:hypothetical protein
VESGETNRSITERWSRVDAVSHDAAPSSPLDEGDAGGKR